jgi:uncharacterized membrane protein
MSIDCLRGLVMILMALDHTRALLSDARFAPLGSCTHDAGAIPHALGNAFCAPVFFLLAGAGASLSRAHGRTVPEISRFFLTRGLWLVLLELTVVSVGWCFTLRIVPWTAGVIWALGWSMVLMAPLVWLPLPAIAIAGLALIGLHNVTDAVQPEVLARLVGCGASSTFQIQTRQRGCESTTRSFPGWASWRLVTAWVRSCSNRPPAGAAPS